MVKRYVSDFPTTLTPSTPFERELVEWLTREHQRIQDNLETVYDFEAEAVRTEPTGRRLKDRDGMLRYVPDDQYDPTVWAGKGYNYYNSAVGAWRLLASLAQGEGDLATKQDLANLYQWVIDNFVTPGYGGIAYVGPGAGFGIIGSTWQTIDAFNTNAVSTPEAVIQNLANNSITILETGVWVVQIGFSLSHNEVNQGRKLQLRLFNITDGAQVGFATVVGTGRNQGNTTYFIGLLAEIDSALVNKELVAQIRSESDTYTSNTFEDAEFSTFHVSTYLGEVIPPI